MDTISYVLIMEELSKVDASASVIVSVNNSLVCYDIETYGSEAQKEKYLTKLATGEHVGAFCLSEPEAGSDATSQQTTAIDQGDHYVINGTKNWITNGGRSDVYIVIAQTDRSKGSKGINAFIIEKGMAGFEIGPKEDKLGIRGSDMIRFWNIRQLSKEDPSTDPPGPPVVNPVKIATKFNHSDLLTKVTDAPTMERLAPLVMAT